MLSRSGGSERDPQPENTQQHQYHQAHFARIDGFHRQAGESHQQSQRDPLPGRGPLRPTAGIARAGGTLVERSRLPANYFDFDARRALVQFPTPGARPRGSNAWCTGEDSNLRSSKERQIYSLLPLTARPPVPNHPSDERPVAGDPAQLFPAPKATHAPGLQHTHSRIGSRPERPPAFRSMHLSGITAEDRSGAQKNRSPANNHQYQVPFFWFPLSGAGEGI